MRISPALRVREVAAQATPSTAATTSTHGSTPATGAEWVDWCNNRRLHGSLGHVPPIEYETAYYAAHTGQFQPT